MGKKSGKQTTEVRLPPALEQAAKDNLAIANEVAAIGYTPYGGATVAGFSPQQKSAFANTDAAAQAFNMPSVAPAGAGLDPLTGIPLSSVDPNGDYNPMAIFKQALASIPPKQRAMLESFVTNPQTGAWPSNPAVPRPQFSPAMPGRTPAQMFPQPINQPAAGPGSYSGLPYQGATDPTAIRAGVTPLGELTPYERWKRMQAEQPQYARGGR